MKFIRLALFVLSMFSFLSGLGAEPAKPDFAFPKTVSKNAEADLKEALKQKQGPEILSALIRYSLAQTAIDPEKTEAVGKYLIEVEQKVSEPVTKAMIQILRGKVLSEDSLAFMAWKNYAAELRQAPVTDWKTVVDVQPQFFPTLYDFAATQADFHAVGDDMAEYYKDQPLPRLYWLLSGYRDYDELIKGYDSIKEFPESVYLIGALNQRAQSIEYRQQVYAIVQEWKSRFPSSPYRPDIEQIEQQLCIPSMSIRAENVVGLGRTLKLHVNVFCLNAASVNIQQIKGLGALSTQRRMKFQGSGVFVADTTLELSFDNYGVYRISPVFTGEANRRNRDFIDVTVTDLLLWRENYGKEGKTYALDVINGAPQNDVKFSEVRNMISATRGNDRFTPEIYKGYDDSPDTRVRYSANILTDRGIYHPGETARFAAVVMAVSPSGTAPSAGKAVTAYLRNANYERIDTLKLVTDDFGRVQSEFQLPSEGLTGYFRIELEDLGATGLTVTDYKAPTFEVKAESERLSEGSARVSGSAIGYNGFPIADAEVKVFIETVPRWVWWRDFRNVGGSRVAEISVKTDAEGKFEAILDFEPTEDNLIAKVEVASPTGETHDDSAFLPARPYFISAEVPRYLLAGNAPEIKVLNSKGNPENIPLMIELVSAKDSIIVTPDANWTNVPSGEYSLKIRTEDPAFAFPVELEQFFVYRLADKMPPTEMSLFVPLTTCKPDDEILVGTSYSDSNILMTIWDGDNIFSQKWLTPAEGNFRVKAEIPDSVNNATVSLVTLRNYHTERKDIRVIRPDVPRNLNLKFASFRDRMVPGEKERWTISVTDNLGNPAEAALMLDVYSKALDAIQPFNWSFNVPRFHGKFWNLNSSRCYSPTAYASSNIRRHGRELTISAPSFNLYGRSFPALYEEIYYRTSNRMVMKMADVEYASADMVEDCAMVYDVCESAPAMAAGATSANFDGGMESVEEEAEEENGAPASAVEEYRLPEVAVALWAPVLTSAPDGSLQVEFEAPNANTTWRLICQAYDLKMLTGSHEAEIIAAKPVMVQPHVPRFLRVGDRTELRSLVMNASDSVATVESFIEIFDPVTEEVIARQDFNSEIAAGASEPVSMPLTAPDRSMLGIRVKASTGNFSDGEQSIIAILPAVITARSAKPLFFGADSTDVRIDAPKGSVVTLTTNAAWECVTALPGLAASESKSAFAATSALFSAAVGRGLVRTYPQIAAALNRWSAEDSVLISKLSKNEDLKIALLSETPWPAAAQTDTERMARLLLLLDKSEADRVINQSVEALAKLVRKGGLAWTPDSDEPSMWVTEEFLSVVAQLRRLGYQPSSSKLNRIISEAVRYLDGEVTRDYAKYKGEYPDYAELRPYFSEIPQSAPAKRAEQATVKHLVSHWRDLGFTGQAQAALVLQSSGYQSTARTIIESLRQYEAWRQTGLNAELLDAFAAVEPRCAEVDEIRQFFIERKQAMEWGSELPTSHLIASILSCGTNWLIPADNEMTLTVNGVETKPEGVESVMGAFRLNLPEGAVVELRKGQFPAWGGVFTALTDTVSEIPAVESEKLKVTRRIEGDLSVGSRIKIILEIEAAQPLDYVVVKSPRSASLSLIDQLPGGYWLPGSYAYREPLATETDWFFSRLGRGKTVITEEFFVTSEGTFLFAPAEAQSQYAPEFHSHSAGSKETVVQTK